MRARAWAQWSGTDRVPHLPDNGASHVKLSSVEVEYYFYTLASKKRPFEITLSNRRARSPQYSDDDFEDGPPEPNGHGEDDDEDEVPAATVLNLPAGEVEGLWESLVYEAQTKDTLLGHSDATLAFSDKMIDPNIITCNR